MKLLLDTHVFLWSVTDPDRLEASTRAAVEDGANDVRVSIVIAWKIATVVTHDGAFASYGIPLLAA